jgi:hypothetical protein
MCFLTGFLRLLGSSSPRPTSDPPSRTLRIRSYDRSGSRGQTVNVRSHTRHQRSRRR